MKIDWLSAEEVLSRLELPFNPPVLSGDVTEERFFEEWHFVQSRLERDLAQTWNRDDFGFGDYSIGDSAGLSRGISLVATSNLFMRDDLIPRIQSILREVPAEYEVHLSVGEQGEMGELFIGRESILGNCSPEIARSLGLHAR